MLKYFFILLYFSTFAKESKMININNTLCDNNKSREELLQTVKMSKTTNNDFVDIVKTVSKALNIELEDVVNQLVTTNANLNESVKLIDEDTNEIYGVLIFSDFKLSVGSPITMSNNLLASYLDGLSQTNGFLFVIDKRLRNSGIDKKMLLFNKEYTDKYDFIWCAVDNDLKSHNYWKKIGFIDVLDISEAKYYILPKDKNLFFNIFIIKLLSE